MYSMRIFNFVVISTLRFRLWPISGSFRKCQSWYATFLTYKKSTSFWLVRPHSLIIVCLTWFWSRICVTLFSSTDKVIPLFITLSSPWLMVEVTCKKTRAKSYVQALDEGWALSKAYSNETSAVLAIQVG